MPAIATARGDIDAAALGVTLFHEHTFMVSPGVLANWPQTFDREAVLKAAVETLEEARGAGVQTIVDVTTIDLGRDVGLQRALAERTSMQIVVATGVHLHPSRFLLHEPDERIVELFVDDIERGIGGTAVRAGVLKVASGAAVTPDNERLLRLVARAQRATGVPIITHSDAEARTGAEQQRVFAEEGVDLGRVVVGHVGDSTDVEYLTALAERGSLLGMDRFGLNEYCSFEDRVATVAELCRRGFASQLLLSHDTACYYDALPPRFRWELHPDWKFTTIPNLVVPALKERGVTEEQVRTMLVENPRRLLTRVH
jgi:phosphotriesterase-related protein